MAAPDHDPARPTDWRFEDAPLLVKDLLRGLKNELKRFDPTRFLDEQGDASAVLPLPLHRSPFHLAADLVRETRRAAHFGTSLARDLIDPHREDSLASLGAGRQSDRAHYVRARYQAARHILQRWGVTHAHLRERPLAHIWATLPSTRDDDARELQYDRLANAAIRLAQSGAITSDADPRIAFRVYAAIALAEAMLALSRAHSDQTYDPIPVIAALDLAAEVVFLRQSTFDAMMNGFDPTFALSAALRSLAPHLIKG